LILYLSTTRSFDAPEFALTLRYRHPARGHRFCPRVLYSLKPPFWPISGTLRLPVTVVLHWSHAVGKWTRNWFPILFQKVAVPFVSIEVDLLFPLVSLFLYLLFYHVYFIRSQLDAVSFP
jgi:hypothetical protein